MRTFKLHGGHHGGRFGEGRGEDRRGGGRFDGDFGPGRFVDAFGSDRFGEDGNGRHGGRGRFFAMRGDDEGRGRGRHGGPFGMFGGGFGGGRFGGRGFDGPGFGGPGFDGEGPRRRGKRFDGEGLRLMVLALLAEAPQHGYQLIRAFAERSNDAYQPSPGVLYPLLAMLTDEGLLAEAEGTGNRRSFAITEAGSAELATHAEKVELLFARLAALGGDDGRPDIAPVRRAMLGLRSAVIDRVGKVARAKPAEGEDAASVRDTVLEIARLIDEVTQKVERL